MRDPLNTLRNDLINVVGSPYNVAAHVYADKTLEFLATASGEQRRALLGILGYEVRHGWMLEWATREGVEGWAVDPYMTGLDGEPEPADVPVLVLRDQRETTDA